MINCVAQKKNFWIKSFKEISDKYSYYVFDCDGVIWQESKAIKETVENIQQLKSKNKLLYFLSNGNRLTRSEFHEKLKNFGIDVDISTTYTSSYLIGKYISEKYPEIKHLFLIGSLGLQNELEEQGFIIYGGEYYKNIQNITDFSTELSENVEINENIQACICGFDDKINYYKLFYALQVINKTKLFFGTNIDRQARTGSKLIPATGTFVKAIEHCSGVEAEVITKPNPRSLSIIMSNHNVDLDSSRDKILMIGDNLNTDIQFANNTGIDSLLVLSGVTSEEEALRIEEKKENCWPTYILKSFSSIQI